MAEHVPIRELGDAVVIDDPAEVDRGRAREREPECRRQTGAAAGCC